MSDADRSVTPNASQAGISSALAHRMAHEIRSPLGVVRGALEQIIAKDDGSAAMGRLAHRSCARLVRLADRLDRIAAMTAAAPLPDSDPPSAPVELQAALGAAVERAVETCGRSRIEVHTELGGSLEVPPRTADALSVATEEIVHNAIAHARRRVEVTLSVSEPVTGSSLCLTATDDGSGIDPALATFRAPGSVGSGLGLGLWLAKSALDGHGATIEVRPGDDAGTTARIVLPLRNPEAA